MSCTPSGLSCARAATGSGRPAWSPSSSARSAGTLEILTGAQRTGDPARYLSHLLHAEPDGSFSIVAMVWLPGQVTPVHDHVTWCVFGVLQGAEHEGTVRAGLRRAPPGPDGQRGEQDRAGEWLRPAR